MRTRAAYFGELLKTSFWLTPAVTALAVAMTLPLAKWLEDTPLSGLPLLEGQTLEGTRLVLSSIATAVMTVVGVLFSVTVVVLQQVSQQYSPRVIENFIRSTSNQFVLGFYIGTFAYCVLLLGTIQERGERAPVIPPSLGILFAMVCLALLIYFVHHLVKSIRSNTIAAGIARQAVAAIDNLSADAAARPTRSKCDAAGRIETLRSADSGYLQEINFRAIARGLRGARWRGRLLVTPGDYLFNDMEIIEIETGTPVDERVRRAIVRAFKIDLERTHTQDVRFGVQELVDIALRALSPGINDPTTAIEAVNEIGTILVHYTCAPCERPRLHFDDGTLELAEPTFEEFVDFCVNDIAIAGRSFFRVQQRIHAMLSRCETAANEESRRESIRSKASALARLAEDLPGRDLYHEPLFPEPPPGGAPIRGARAYRVAEQRGGR